MMKIFLVTFALLTFLWSEEDKNLGFMMNQKYMCVSTHAMVGEKVIQVQTQEDALKYPSRFYIDDNNILHTDGRKDNLFQYVKDSEYKNDDSVILLQIKDNKRYMLRLKLTGELKGIAFIYTCVETDNWTIVR
jgi:hypothetical protein